MFPKLVHSSLQFLKSIHVSSTLLCFFLMRVYFLFGGKKLPEFARNLGKGIREFKRASQGLDEEIECVPVRSDEEISAKEKKNRHE